MRFPVFTGFPQRNKIFDTPQLISYSGGHCGRHSERSVNLNEIVGKVIQGGRSSVIPQLAREPITEPRVPSHLRSYRPVLSLDRRFSIVKRENEKE